MSNRIFISAPIPLIRKNRRRSPPVLSPIPLMTPAYAAGVSSPQRKSTGGGIPFTAEELDQLACLTDDAHEREIIQAIKELTSFQMEMSEEEYKQAEDAVYDRTVKESEEVDESLQNGEKPEDAPKMEEAEAVGPSLANLSL